MWQLDIECLQVLIGGFDFFSFNPPKFVGVRYVVTWSGSFLRDAHSTVDVVSEVVLLLKGVLRLG